MIKLYEIKELHGAPKDSTTFVRTRVLVDNEEQAYQFAKEKYYWFDYMREEMEEDNDLTPEEIDAEMESREKEYRECGGELYSDDANWDDAYYGITQGGFKFVEEITEDQAKVLLDLGIAKDLRS